MPSHELQGTETLRLAALEKVFPLDGTYGFVHSTGIGKDGITLTIGSFLNHGIVPTRQLQELGIEPSKKPYTHNDSVVFVRQVRFKEGYHPSYSQRDEIAFIINPNHFWSNPYEAKGTGENAEYTTETVIKPENIIGIVIGTAPFRPKPNFINLPVEHGENPIEREINISISDIETQVSKIKALPFYKKQEAIVRKGMKASGNKDIGMSEESLNGTDGRVFYLLREGASPPYSEMKEPDGTDVWVFALPDKPKDPKREGRLLYNLCFLSHLESRGELNERTRTTFVEYYNWLKKLGIGRRYTVFNGDLGIPYMHATSEEKLVHREEVHASKRRKRREVKVRFRETIAQYEEEVVKFQSQVYEIVTMLEENGLPIPLYASDGTLLWPQRIALKQVKQLDRRLAPFSQA